MIVVFVCLTDYSLQTVVIRLCRNFRDCFGGGLSFRNYEKTHRAGTRASNPKVQLKKSLFQEYFEILLLALTFLVVTLYA